MVTNSLVRRVAYGLVGTSLLNLLFAASPSAQTLSELVLVETVSHSDVAILTPGDTFNLAEVGRQINLRVEFSGGEPGSVQLRLSGPEFMERVENHPPFTLLGDVSGIYNPWTPQVGEYNLIVEAYAGENLQGRLLDSKGYSFIVIDEDDTKKRPLKVISGSGSGNYPPGKKITIKADTPPKHQRFLIWMGNNESVEDLRESRTRIVMPEQETTVVATYRLQKENAKVTLHGDQLTDHKISIDLNGPYQVKSDKPDELVDFRFQVVFISPDGKEVEVPGIFVGNGDGGKAGNTWRAEFSPQQAGEWTYSTQFHFVPHPSGDEKKPSQPRPLAPYHHIKGSFKIAQPETVEAPSPTSDAKTQESTEATHQADDALENKTPADKN